MVIIVYAKMCDGQNGGLQYVWDGENVIVPKVLKAYLIWI